MLLEVSSDEAELRVTPAQSVEWSGACPAYVDRQIYTIFEADRETTCSTWSVAPSPATKRPCFETIEGWINSVSDTLLTKTV